VSTSSQESAQEPVDVLIDEDEVARLLAKRGQVVKLNLRPYVTEATADSIHRWCDATGDRNPLWRDPEYARRWGHTDVLAPPAMLYAFDRLSIGYRGGLPGVHSFFGGTHWRWHASVGRNAGLQATVTFKDLIKRKSTFAEISFQQLSEIAYHDSDDQLVAEAEAWGMRTSRRAARSNHSLESMSACVYTPEDIARIAEEYATEEVQTQPRDAAGVEVGESVPSIIRGPYTVTNAIAFEQAWGGLFIRTHGDWFDLIQRHPALALINHLGIPEPPEAVHWDREFARRAGVPEPYDYGPERVAWLAVLLTNWMGPAGFLRELNVQVRKFNLVGDLTRCRGTVTALEKLEGDRRLVRLDVWAENQRQERTAFGTAAVVL
jgi:acyl dehydratase